MNDHKKRDSITNLLSLSEHDTTAVTFERYKPSDSHGQAWTWTLQVRPRCLDVETRDAGGIGASVRDMSWKFHGI